MAGRVVLLKLALQDIQDLFAFVAQESGTDRAELILRRIEATAQSLANWPGIGRIRQNMDGAPRAFSVGPWLIVYEALPSGEGIAVWRIIDGRRDLTDLIHPPRPV
jgi:toxin ParE1/3/4